jgi:hypothetical protein
MPEPDHSGRGGVSACNADGAAVIRCGPDTASGAVSTCDAAVGFKCQFFDSCGSVGNGSSNSAKNDGWHRWKFAKGKNWLCVPCHHAMDNFEEVSMPRFVTQPEAGKSIYVDEFFLVRCACCLRNACFLCNGGPRRGRWENRKTEGYVCSLCTNNPADRQLEPADSNHEPPMACTTESALSHRVIELTVALNMCMQLPPWVHDPNDAALKLAASDYPRVEGELDPGNSPGSMLVLAMLLPEQFGVPGGPSLNIFGDSPPEGITNISEQRATSSYGSDNRRTNIIEGLLNYWQDMDEPTRPLLLEVWGLMGRVYQLMDPLNTLRVADLRRNVFAVPDSFMSDDWYEKRMCAREYFKIEIWKLIALCSRPVEKLEFEDEARRYWYNVLSPEAIFKPQHSSMALGCTVPSTVECQLSIGQVVMAMWHGSWLPGKLWMNTDGELQILWDEDSSLSNLVRPFVKVVRHPEIGSVLGQSVIGRLNGSWHFGKVTVLISGTIVRVHWDQENSFSDLPISDVMLVQELGITALKKRRLLLHEVMLNVATNYGVC